MDPRFKLIDEDEVIPADADGGAPGFQGTVTAPWNQVFKIVFFPDRIYHAQYLNATRSPRYQYNVVEVRGRADFIVMKAEVYLDGNFYCNALRIEYRGGRLAEQVRERGRLIGDAVLAWVELSHQDTGLGDGLKRYVKLFYDSYIDAYQAEIWETLEAPATTSHSFKVLDQMGLHKPITSVPGFRKALRDIRGLSAVRASFREPETDRPLNYKIESHNAGWDNDYARSHQEPNRPEPNSDANTVRDSNYQVSFQRGFVRDARATTPVYYQNAMMEPSSADYHSPTQAPTPGQFDGSQNVMGMRWIIQRELGGTVVYFHEVELPPGAVEGTHQHVGSEELYYFTEGEGIAYLGDGDDPDVDAKYPLVDPMPDIYGLGPKPCREIPVRPGITLFTKSGGIHGVRNPKGNAGPLKFVAFGYHSS